MHRKAASTPLWLKHYARTYSMKKSDSFGSTGETSFLWTHRTTRDSKSSRGPFHLPLASCSVGSHIRFPAFLFDPYSLPQLDLPQRTQNYVQLRGILPSWEDQADSSRSTNGACTMDQRQHLFAQASHNYEIRPIYWKPNSLASAHARQGHINTCQALVSLLWGLIHHPCCCQPWHKGPALVLCIRWIPKKPGRLPGTVLWSRFGRFCWARKTRKFSGFRKAVSLFCKWQCRRWTEENKKQSLHYFYSLERIILPKG